MKLRPIQYKKGKPFGDLEIGEEFEGFERADDQKYSVIDTLGLWLRRNFSHSAWNQVDKRGGLLRHLFVDQVQGFINLVTGYLEGKAGISRQYPIWARDFGPLILDLTGPCRQVKYNGDQVFRFMTIGVLDKVPLLYDESGRAIPPCQDSKGVILAAFGLSSSSIAPVIRGVSIGGAYDHPSLPGSGIDRKITMNLIQVRAGHFTNNSQMGSYGATLDALANPARGGGMDGNSS